MAGFRFLNPSKPALALALLALSLRPLSASAASPADASPAGETKSTGKTAPATRSSAALAKGKGLQFVIGESADLPPAANVTVKQVVQPPKKRSLFRKKSRPTSIADGVAVRFEHLKTAALAELPETMRAMIKTTRLQMRRLALFAPGDPVPRLMAEEATIGPKGEWTLKRVLLADRPAAKECKLVLKDGIEPSLSLPKGDTLALNSLLAPPKTTAP